MLEDYPSTKSGMTATEIAAAASVSPPHTSLCSSTSSKGLKATDLLGMGVLKELKRSTSRKKQRYRTTPYPREALIDESDNEGENDDEEKHCDACPISSSSSSFGTIGDNGGSPCSSPSEYHLYEEILYEASDKPPANIPKPPSPPPLPERPPLILKSALESLKSETKKDALVGNKHQSKFDSISRSSPSLIHSSQVLSLSCCRCPCEVIPKKQSKQTVNDCSLRTRNEEAHSEIEQNLAIPPIPPLRTTSQLTLGALLLCPLKSSGSSSTPEIACGFSSNQNELLSQQFPLVSPPLGQQQTTSLLSEVSPNLGTRSKPTVPPRKSLKHCKLVTLSKRDSTIDTHISLPSKEPLKTKGGKTTKINEFPTLVSQSGKPKQRSNLYSIFKDRHHRRFLSASLELEYHQQPELPKSKKGNEMCLESEFCYCCCLGPLLSEARCYPLVGTTHSGLEVSSEERQNTGIHQSLSLRESNTMDLLPNSSSSFTNTTVAESFAKRNFSSIPVTTSATVTSTASSTLLAKTMPSIAETDDEKPINKQPKSSLSVGAKRGARICAARTQCHVTCSLDLGQTVQTEDDYGFHALPNAV